MVSRRSFLRTAARTTGVGVLGAWLPGALRADDAVLVERTVGAMGTMVVLRVYTSSRAHGLAATQAAIEELYRCDRLFSVFDARSDVSRLNRSAGRSEVTVHPDVVDLFRMAARFHDRTDRLFDLTLEPLMRYYGFRPDSDIMSDERADAFARLREDVGMQHVHISGDSLVTDHPGTQLDFGGIAVGYTLDRMTAILRREGIESALIDHSGDIVAMGAPPGEEGWRIAIEDPATQGSAIESIVLRNESISTSSNVKNVRGSGKAAVGHILDPRTGRNAESIRQLTVIAPSAVAADALSTGWFNASSGSGLSVALKRHQEGQERASVYVCFEDGQNGGWIS